MIYLDNSSTTRQDHRVTEAMLPYMEQDFGNPSSLHHLGLQAENGIKQARKTTAEALGGVQPEEVYFTSGGTEADNTAVFGAALTRKRRGRRILTSKVEHPAVLECMKRLERAGFEIVYLDVDESCRLNGEEVLSAIDEQTVLVSLMAVNNETGTVFPLSRVRRGIEAINREKGTEVLLHSDAVQAFGKIRLPKADLLSVSGHKVCGPKGTGALYMRKGLTLEPHLYGGGQEKHMRSGTENVPGIVGFGKAAALAHSHLAANYEAMAAAREYLLAGIRDAIRDIRVNSPEALCGISGEAGLGCPSVLSVSFLGTRGEVLLHRLEQDEIYVSTGSACASNKKGASHVLTAMGLTPKEIEGTLRFSFSASNTVEEMDFVLDRLKAAVNGFRRLGSFR